MVKSMGEIQKALARIDTFTFDVDGVATDGSLTCFTNGDFIRVFDAKDGQAIRIACMNGYTVGIITGGHSLSIKSRFKTSGIPEENIILLANDKKEAFIKFCADRGLDPQNVVYAGDDLPDIPVFKLCGLSICPADAAPEVKEAADIISPYPGGKGMLRHLIEMTLRLQGRWNLDVKRYSDIFDNLVEIK